jgi:fumarate reductase flavoprotein subunit
MQYDYDVIVVGAGGAGLAAAVTATSAGARTLIVEADRKVGGSTAMSGGVVWASQTSIQRQAGIADDAAAQFRYYMNLNQHKLEAALVHRLCYDSAAAVEWLIELGVSFPQSNLYVSGVDGIARGHRAAGHGAEIAAALENALAGKNVEVALNSRVTKLRQDADGAVIGIEADGVPVTAPATVIASGGFGNNSRLLSELYPDTLSSAGTSARSSRSAMGSNSAARRAPKLPGATRGYCC